MHWSEVTLPALFCSGQNPYSAPTQQVLFPHPHSTSSLLEWARREEEQAEGDRVALAQETQKTASVPSWAP